MSEPIKIHLEGEEFEKIREKVMNPKEDIEEVLKEVLKPIVMETAKEQCERLLAKGITDPVELYQIAIMTCLYPEEAKEKYFNEENEND